MSHTIKLCLLANSCNVFHDSVLILHFYFFFFLSPAPLAGSMATIVKTGSMAETSHLGSWGTVLQGARYVSIGVVTLLRVRGTGGRRKHICSFS